ETVSGRQTSIRATGRIPGRQTKATTREPGDLPRHVERPRAGCPGRALAGPRLVADPSVASPWPLPQLISNSWGQAVSHSSLSIATLGTPRIGARRELKTALESYWSGKSDEDALLTAASALRAAN